MDYQKLQKKRTNIRRITSIVTLIAAILVLYPYSIYFFTDMTFYHMLDYYVWNWLVGAILSSWTLYMGWKYE